MSLLANRVPWWRVGMSIAGFPLELFSKLGAYCIGRQGKAYSTNHQIVYTCHSLGKTLTVPKGFHFDGATCAPNLRTDDGEISHAFPVHDMCWMTAEWDDKTEMTFERANLNMAACLSADGFPPRIINWYYRGVSLPIMRKLWRKQHGHE